ncbi:flagellar biosynthesis regulator FlaF [Seohaeicola nanhaiensis]|uniref:Flagellar biosynthesis regulator FlaF n=1 Tax=Seohaeicola nanhaiensis TaxID=1387282 RepID=A0ABV9KH63_9RHOB
MSISAYKRTLRELESPRQIERRVMANITGRMAESAEAFDLAETSFDRVTILASGLRDALADNQALWNALKHDLSLPGNALPPDLRAGLLSLAIWVEKSTRAVLGGRGSVRALVTVNSNIVSALNDTPLRRSA